MGTAALPTSSAADEMGKRATQMGKRATQRMREARMTSSVVRRKYYPWYKESTYRGMIKIKSSE